MMSVAIPNTPVGGWVRWWQLRRLEVCREAVVRKLIAEQAAAMFYAKLAAEDAEPSVDGMAARPQQRVVSARAQRRKRKRWHQ